MLTDNDALGDEKCKLVPLLVVQLRELDPNELRLKQSHQLEELYERNKTTHANVRGEVPNLLRGREECLLLRVGSSSRVDVGSTAPESLSLLRDLLDGRGFGRVERVASCK